MTQKPITVITAPDVLYNSAKSVLLVNPSPVIKKLCEQWLSEYNESVNLYIYDETTADIPWLLMVAKQVDHTVIDIDNIDPNVSNFLSYLLSAPNAVYRCISPTAPWELINKNRIFDTISFTD